MIKLTKKYVIGTHVMWFEIEMYKDFIDGMVNLLETVENKENIQKLITGQGKFKEYSDLNEILE
jgi:hypothetical protein